MNATVAGGSLQRLYKYKSFHDGRTYIDSLRLLLQSISVALVARDELFRVVLLLLFAPIGSTAALELVSALAPLKGEPRLCEV